MAECGPLKPEVALEQLRDQVTCAICLLSYTQPKVLHCLHVFCEECLQKLVVRKEGDLTITCAICRKDTGLTAGVAGLQSAFHVNNLLAIENSLRVQVESEVKPSKDKKDTIQACTHHKTEVVNLFCESCKEFICLQCTIQSHNGHQYNTVSCTAEKSKGELLKGLEPAETEVQRLEDTLSLYRERNKSIQSQVAEIEGEVGDTIEQLHQRLDAVKTELLNSLQEVSGKKLRALDVQKSDMDMLLTKLSSCVEYVKNMVKTESDEVVITEENNCLEVLQNLCSESQRTKLEPRERANLVMLTDLRPSLDSFAQLATIATYNECPHKCYATGNGLSSAVMGTTATALLHIVDRQNKPCKCVNTIECEVISTINGSRQTGSVKRRRDDLYDISYEPAYKGKQQLHITIKGQHIKGSPFDITVKSTFRTLHTPFGKIPGITSPHGLIRTQNGEILILTEGEDPISLYKQNGNLVTNLDMVGSFSDITLGDDDNLYGVTTDDCQVMKFTSEGEFVCATGTVGWGPLKFNQPRGIAFNTKNKRLYITNTKHHEIQILNSDLTFHARFGEEGSGKGQLMYPFGICCDVSGRVFVADCGNDRIQVFTPEGKSVRTITKKEMKRPIRITIDDANLLYVCQREGHCVSVFRADGHFLKSFGDSTSLGSAEGVAVDSESGVVFVCDSRANCIQIF